MFSIGDRYGDDIGQGNDRMPCVSRKLRTRNAVLHNLVGMECSVAIRHNPWTYGKAWKSYMPFSMTLSNPLIPHDSGWISISAAGDITERSSTLSVDNDSTCIEFLHLLFAVIQG
ncbi:hypothetical protein TNCV_636231 [Trichonephila clavipes]|nr:hypothetical protein TNCV_636231 [Trichonephila clavipes]